MYSHTRQENSVYHKGGGDLFKHCVAEIVRNIQAPEALVASAALSAISTSLQGVIDVEWPDGRVSPTSLYVLIRGKSGERKSSVFNRVFSSIILFQKNEMTKYKIALEEYEREYALWFRKRDSVLKKISNLTTKAENTSELEKIYLKIEREKPVAPKKLSMLYDDATPEALIYGMSEDCKYAALVSSEGGSILRSGVFKNYANTNELWSGGTIKADRKSAGSSFVENGRLSVCIMVQPEIHDIYLHKESDHFRGSGLWARFVVVEPDTTIGMRQISAGKACWEHSERFANRLTIFLDKMKTILLNQEDRLTVKLSHEAAYIFLDNANHIEIQCRPGHLFNGFEDHASKLPENILRIACLLSAFEYGIASPISADVMRYAIDIALYFSNQFRRIFYTPTKEENENKDMLQWMEDKKYRGIRFLRTNHIQKYGPFRLRKKEFLNPCLARLEQLGLIKNFFLENIQCVDLIPNIHFDHYAASVAIRANHRKY